MNPECPAGGFSVWAGLQGAEDVGGAIAASDADMADLDGRNTQADWIVRAENVVLRVLVGPLTTHQEVGTCCYLIQCLLGPQCPLLEALHSQDVDAIDKDFSLFSMQMVTSHRCTAFSYDVSCIIVTYLNACVKASATASVSDPGGRIPILFQYLRYKLSHGKYVGHPLPPSLQNLFATRDSERAAADRRAREPAPGPTIVGLVLPGPGQGRGGSGAPPRQ